MKATLTRTGERTSQYTSEGTDRRSVLTLRDWFQVRGSGSIQVDYYRGDAHVRVMSGQAPFPFFHRSAIAWVEKEQLP